MDNPAEMDVDQGGRDDNQQFCLKWNSFGSNLAEAFSVLYRSGSMTDCTIFCAGMCLYSFYISSLHI
uniref:Uncharacterized protein n=1 Tax=Trichogramma kaykai TaxID=54128 RepID=A0ABD2W1H4_9HYME